MAPRRSVTAPVGKIDVRVEARQVEEPSPVSPPRHMLDGNDDDDDDDEENSRPTFEAFHFGSDGSAHDDHSPAGAFSPSSSSSSSAVPSEQSRPVSPAHQQQQPSPHIRHEAITPPPEEPQQFPAFSRMGTMPPLHHAPLSFDAAPVRPSTSAGPLAPRAFRRVSRPVFLSPTEGGAEELAGRLSAFLFGGGDAAGALAAQRHSTLFSGGGKGINGQGQQERRGSVLMEEMLKEPGTPRGRAVFGKGEDEGAPVNGIFEVLTKG